MDVSGWVGGWAVIKCVCFVCVCTDVYKQHGNGLISLDELLARSTLTHMDVLQTADNMAITASLPAFSRNCP